MTGAEGLVAAFVGGVLTSASPCVCGIRLPAALQQRLARSGVWGALVLGALIGPALAAGHDPVVSLIIAAVIVVGTWSLFRQSLHLLFDGVPESVDLPAVQALLAGLPGVAQVTDLHVWAMGTSETALTAHLVMPAGGGDDDFLRHATEALHEHFEIRHVTLQVTRAPSGNGCAPVTPTGRS